MNLVETAARLSELASEKQSAETRLAQIDKEIKECIAAINGKPAAKPATPRPVKMPPGKRSRQVADVLKGTHGALTAQQIVHFLGEPTSNLPTVAATLSYLARNKRFPVTRVTRGAYIFTPHLKALTV